MSGGSMNYLYSQIENAGFKCHTPERKAFSAHLAKVARALHDIEWVDSCDYGDGDENEAILACLGEHATLEAAIKAAEEAIAALTQQLARVAPAERQKKGEAR